MQVVGVDENGLGPQLGPLVTTAVVLELAAYEPRRYAKLGRRIGIDDSKATSAFGKMAHAESVSLAVLERLHGAAPIDVDALLAMLSIDTLEGLRGGCPTGATAQCWSAPIALPVFGGDVREGRTVLRRLSRGGVEVVRAKSAIACVRVFNAELRKRASKLAVDLALFERLLLDARSVASTELTAICGMVGGIRRYPEYFDAFAQLPIDVLEEIAQRSAYRVAGVGTVVFEVDSDANHLPVALASMIGKYVRELAMERQGRFYRSHDAALPHASGYHDPVTKRFVAASADLRRRLAIEDDCFVRAR